MPLTPDQRCEAQKIAELEVRRYMDDLFDRTLPRLIRDTVVAHDESIEAHEALFKQQAARLKLAIAAFAAGAGLFGAGTAAQFFGVL